MFVLSDLLTAVGTVLDWVLWFLQVVVFVRALLSWVGADPSNGLVRMIVAIAEPVLRPFRRLVPPWRLQGFDISPILAFLTLLFCQKFLVQILFDAANRMR
jgi:YggT family protein